MTEKRTATNEAPPAAAGEGGEPGLLDQAKQKAGELAEQAQHVAAEMSEKARAQAESQIAVQKDRAAEGLGSVAEALRQTSDELRKKEQAVLPDYVAGAAKQLEQVAKYLKRRDARELIAQVEAFARRSPALYLGGAFALGVFGVRLLRSSGRRRAERRAGALQARPADATALVPAKKPAKRVRASGGSKATSQGGKR